MNGMIERCLIVVLFLLVFERADAQTCIHTNLSEKFDYKITRAQSKQVQSLSLFGGSEITIEIYNKSDATLFQKIQFTSQALYPDDFKICSHDRSLISGKNVSSDMTDNDYGDIVVADINFDDKEDFAVKFE